MPISPLFWKGSYAFLTAVVLAVPSISPLEALKYVGSPDVVFLDVREDYEYETGHIPGSILMPWNSGVLQERWGELPKHRLIIIYCRSGGRAGNAGEFLEEKGFEQLANMGGFSAYSVLPGAIVETGPYQEPVTCVSDWCLLTDRSACLPLKAARVGAGKGSGITGH